MTLIDEALRYMECKHPDTRTLERAGEYLKWLSESSANTAVTLEVPCRVDTQGVSFRDVEIKSVDLARYISGCNELMLFAATLGAGVSRRYRAVSAVSISDALIFDACANAYIEHICDIECAELAKRRRGLTGRFSPGYGDFGLSFQPILANLLQTQKRIGLTVTPDYTLIPEKSVTAIIGIKE